MSYTRQSPLIMLFICDFVTTGRNPPGLTIRRAGGVSLVRSTCRKQLRNAASQVVIGRARGVGRREEDLLGI
jgi:hypothetical protein